MDGITDHFLQLASTPPVTFALTNYRSILTLYRIAAYTQYLTVKMLVHVMIMKLEHILIET